MGFLKDNAGSIIGAAGTIAGWMGIGEQRQDKRQVAQQQKLNDVNEGTSKRLADYEQGLKMKMWEDTNLKAQLEQASKAGVSKAAAIGGSGTGTQGASVDMPSTTGAADAAATSNARTQGIDQSMLLASQLNLMKAQKENIEADTANKQAGAGNTNVDTQGKTIDVDVKRNTQKDTEKGIKEGANKTSSDASIRANEEVISNRTMKEQETKVKAESIGAELDNEVKRAGINVDKAKVTEIANNIAQRWKAMELEAKGQELSRENVAKMAETMLWSAGINAAGNIVKSVTDVLMKNKFGKHNTQTNTTRETRNGVTYSQEQRSNF